MLETYTANISKKQELPELYEFIKGILGDDIMPYDKVLAHHTKNPNILHVVRDIDHKICGFFGLSFLDRAATEELTNGQKRAIELSADNMLPPGEVPVSIYIGAVGAEDTKFSRGATAYYLLSTLKSFQDKYQCEVLVRPLTPFGLNALSKRGFVPLTKPGMDNLYRLDC